MRGECNQPKSGIAISPEKAIDFVSRRRTISSVALGWEICIASQPDSVDIPSISGPHGAKTGKIQYDRLIT
jgi:hypothetical protein